MNKIIKICMVLLLLAIGTGCRKYVEIPQPGTSSLRHTSDYQALLNTYLTVEPTYFYPVIASDDVESSEPGFWQNTLTTSLYTYEWSGNVFGDSDDPDWNKMYYTIYVYNLVATGVMSSDGGTDAQKKYILAQALAHRAYTYLQLVNIYAKQYDAATATTDPGVPLLLEAEFTGSLKRASVQEVYDQCKKDLQAALADLPDLQAYAEYQSKTSVYAILSRASLQQGIYADAEKYADSALAKQSALINLADYATSTATFPHKLLDPETMLIKTLINASPTFPLSNDLLSLFSTNDLRYKLFTNPGTNLYPTFTGRGYWRHRLTNEGVYVGPSVPEMMLIKAECEARAGNAGTSVDILNTLRQHRFLPADYAPEVAADAATALQLTIDERRRELMCTGLRWFDQKRLNKEAAFAKIVTRTYQDQTYTLEPNSNAYVFPIANKYLKTNPEIVPNPR